MSIELKAVDCHAHFYPPNYTQAEIQTHIEKRVEIEQHNLSLLAIVVTPETHSEASTVLAQFTSHNILKPCIGLHPVQHVINNGETISISAHESQLDEVLALIQAKKDEIVAVGEIGLDFSPWILNASAQAWNCSVDQVKAIQRKVFERQVLLAKELDLAVNVHSRNAGHHAIAILEENGMLGRCLLHAFDGAPKHAVRAAQLGAMFSIPGSIARDTSTKKLVEKLELVNICLESDAPALPPIKGDRTWPLDSLKVAVEHIASIKNISIEQVILQTTENACKLFGIKA